MFRNMALDHNKLVRIFLVVLGTLALFFIFFSNRGISLSFRNVRQNHITVFNHLPLGSIKEDIAGNIARKLIRVVPLRSDSEAEKISGFLEVDMHRLMSLLGSTVRFFDARCEVRVFTKWISPAEMFSRKEFLAVESLFKAHPKGCLIILSRTMDSVEGRQILKPFLDRGLRVITVAPELSYLVNGTPAKTLLEDLKMGKKEPIKIWLVRNLCNLIWLVV